MSDFFEYKYLVMDNFYSNICKDKYTYTQSGGKCFVDFGITTSENDILFFAVYSTILSQIAKYDEDLTHFEEEYLLLNKLYNSLPICELLSKNEQEYLKDDIDFIKYKFEKKYNL